jgi:hypothetical protein
MPAKNKKEEIADNIIINENIYVYQKDDSKFFTKRTIKNLFEMARVDKERMYVKVLADLNSIAKKIASGMQYRLSLLVLRYIHKASFIDRPISSWTEQKMAYLMLLDFGKYLFILRRNISGITNFTDELNPIDYNTLMKLFQEVGTVFEKFSMQNLDVSRQAMKSKMAESDNLEDNFNYVGANTYTLNYLRLKNDTQRYLLSLRSSRVNKTGEKVSINTLADSCSIMVEAIEKFKDKESLLDVFAAPCEYSKERLLLQPVVLTLQFDVLIDELSSGKVTYLAYEYDNRERLINLSKYLKSLYLPVPLGAQVEMISMAESNLLPKCLRAIGVTMNQKSIRITSEKFRRIKVFRPDGRRESLIDYLNTRQLFQVNFDACEYAYSKRKLFKDSALFNSIPFFLKAFEADSKLQSVTSEKGSIKSASTYFTLDSIFGYVEEKSKHCEFMVLDDLGNEWADHICISGSTITFIHSKYDDTAFSATSFSDIVTQAKKNIGNMFSASGHVIAKKAIWGEYYVLNKTKSKIKRLRIGKDVDSFVKRYIEVRQDPNPKRAICLALNFMSLQKLTENLTLLKENKAFAQRKQAIQILWVISSLIANCRDNGIELKILCKP